MTICLKCRSHLTEIELNEGICLTCIDHEKPIRIEEDNLYDAFFVDPPEEPKARFQVRHLIPVLVINILLLVVTLMIMYSLGHV